MKRNIMPIIGLVLGIGLIVWAMTSSGDDANFVDSQSLIITVAGSFCALLISFPLKTLKKIPSVLKVLILSPKEGKEELVILFSDLAKKARQNGLLALEDDIAQIEDEFLVNGLQMVVDGVEPEVIREIMELKLEVIEKRHRTGQQVFEKWGDYAPAFGMLGTLIGLILMLANLSDPSSIGVGMATALLTTFYGAFLANMVLLPIAANLKAQTDEEIFFGEMIIDGVLEIQAGSNPRLLGEKLNTYLAPEELDVLEKLAGEEKYD